MKYEDYIKQIDELTKEYNFSAMEKASLQISASFECNEISYNKILGELIKKRLEIN